MNRITTIDDAKDELIRLTQAEAHPVIDQEEELPSILNKCVLATLWTTGTAYIVGDVVQANVPNGKRFVCVISGTSGTTEPTFSTWRDSRTSDGSVTWQEAGDEYLNLWDMDRAASLGWELKAQKALKAVNTVRGQQSYDLSVIYDRCIEQANRYRTVRVG